MEQRQQQAQQQATQNAQLYNLMQQQQPQLGGFSAPSLQSDPYSAGSLYNMSA